MNRSTVDPTALHVALRRIERREAAARRRRTTPSLWRRIFTPRHRREHVARLGPAEVVHSNLAS
jgi:hypothetical protein